MTKYGFQGVMPATVPYNTDTGVGIYIREKGVRGELLRTAMSRDQL